ncbi:MAG: hypothetical protein HOB00_10510 [Verrucomicrobia bacterium]|nr:hypothetical protein [Verrucomicrobiota bacterium]
MKITVKTAAALSAILLAGLVCVPAVFADKAKFYSSKGGSSLKRRTTDTQSGVGRSSLNKAKSMSGVGRALYPGGSATMDRSTTKKLLELFDQKKNWIFQDLEEDGKTGDTGEEWSRENDLLGDERDNRKNSFFKSRGAVEDFLRSDEKEKRPRKKNRRRVQPERLSGEDDQGELSESEFEMSPDKLKKDGRKKEESLFRANSPFAAKTALADFSPFSGKNTKSTTRYRTPGNRAGLNGNRLEAGKALGQAGAAGRVGFFQQQGKSVRGGSNKNFFSANPGGAGKGALGLDPMSFGRSFAPKPSTPVTGVGVGEMSSGFNLPPGLASPVGANSRLSSYSAAPQAAAQRELPLLFQSRDRGQPSIRSGLLNQKPGKKPGRGF